LKINRQQLENPCAGCGKLQGTPSLCCQAFVVETPLHTTYPDQVNLDMLHWYMVRGANAGWTVRATFAEGLPSKDATCWQIYIKAPCPMLDAQGGCTIYEHRPAICREYPPFPSYRENDPSFEVSGCERYDPEPEPDYIFDNPFELLERLADWFGYDPSKHVRYVTNPRYVKVADE
jgi:Fe-S-cluster containining protein